MSFFFFFSNIFPPYSQQKKKKKNQKVKSFSRDFFSFLLFVMIMIIFFFFFSLSLVVHERNVFPGYCLYKKKLSSPEVIKEQILKKNTQDVGVLADCERIVQESIDALGGLDIIINNAVRPTPPPFCLYLPPYNIIHTLTNCSIIPCPYEFCVNRKVFINYHQGWTKFTSNVDLDALTDEEWDKVRVPSPSLTPR